VSFTAQPVSDQQFLLAEGPLWDPVARRVLWVDIRAGLVLEGRLAGDVLAVVARHELGGTVGAVVPAADGSLLVAAADGFALVRPDGEVLRGPRVLPGSGTGRRFNDAAVDPAGRLLAGAMAEDGRRGEEHLYRLDADGTVTVADSGLTMSNGIAWSPDGRTMYHAESALGVVWRRPYDVATGDVGPREEWLRPSGGVPDGLCTDAGGNVWVAVHGAGEVRAFDPDGGQVATVRVPAPHTTKPAFVGPALDRLLVTTARDELSPEQRAAWPLSGRLFLADVGYVAGVGGGEIGTGRPAQPWAGDAASFAASIA
jgi:sugar lactone lactonase YvrE